MNSMISHMRETGAIYYDPSKSPRCIESNGELKPIAEHNGMTLYVNDGPNVWCEIRKDGETISRGWHGYVVEHMWKLVLNGWQFENNDWHKPA